METATTFLNNLVYEIMDLLISEGVKVYIRPPMETNHQGIYRLLMVRKAAVESENKTITIKASVQPAG